jgi:glucuronokinase
MEPKVARGRAQARAALVGNPSDGFGGATIAVTLPEFAAEAEVTAAPLLEIVPADEDRNTFRDLDELVADVAANGYYGGLRLVKAAVKRFAQHCAEAGVEPAAPSFRVRYSTSIPRQVGLGGSSAIVIATMRALCDFHDLELQAGDVAALALSAETEELEIPAGPQDRFVQAHGGLLFMDFAGPRPGVESLEPASLPPLFVAYRTDASEPSAVIHSELRRRHAEGDPVVASTMAELAALARRGRDALRSGRGAEVAPLIERNLDLRRRVLQLDPRHERMVEIAREHGAAANYAGSGGAIVGIRPNDSDALTSALEAEGCAVLEPALPG